MSSASFRNRTRRPRRRRFRQRMSSLQRNRLTILRKRAHRPRRPRRTRTGTCWETGNEATRNRTSRLQGVRLQGVRLQVVRLRVVRLQVVRLQVVRLQVVRLQRGLPHARRPCRRPLVALSPSLLPLLRAVRMLTTRTLDPECWKTSPTPLCLPNRQRRRRSSPQMGTRRWGPFLRKKR